MVNSWSLADSVINGTMDEDYPIKDAEEQPWIYESPDGGKTVYQRRAGQHPSERIRYDQDVLDGLCDDTYPTLNSEVQEKETMANYFKYHEEEILKDIEEYVSATYRGHYTGTKHEYRNVQTIDLMASRDLAPDFCQSNILKYGSRYGSKDGRNKKDLMKVIHYAMLLLHFDDHYGKPSMTSGNIDHNMP